jgi:hypothetical protein
MAIPATNAAVLTNSLLLIACSFAVFVLVPTDALPIDPPWKAAKRC